MGTPGFDPEAVPPGTTRPRRDRHIQDIADRRIMAATTDNQKLLDWVDDWAAILQPDDVDWCDGSDEEYDRLCAAAGRRRHVRAR